MPDDSKLEAYILDLHSKGISADDIQAEVDRIVQAQAPKAPAFNPQNPMQGLRVMPGRAGGGGQVVTNQQYLKAVEQSDPAGIASTFVGAVAPPLAIPTFLAGRALEKATVGMAGGETPSVADTAAEAALMYAAPKVIGGAIKGGLKVAKPLVKGVGNVTENLLARLAGVGTQELRTAATTPAITEGTAPRAFDVVAKMRSTLDKIRGEGIPEYSEAKEMLKSARPVRLGPAMRVLTKGVPQPIGAEERAAAKELRNTMSDIMEATQSRSWAESIGKRVPAQMAERLKQALQKMADFSGRPTDDPLNPVLKRAAGSLRSSIEASLPSSAERSKYASLMRSTSQKMDVVGKLTQRVGEYKDSAENFVRLLHRAGKTEQRDLVGKFDKLFKTSFLEESRVADALEAFDGETPSFTAPRFTATGGLLGPGLGMTIGASMGGIPGGMIGAGVGLAGASPRGAIAFARGNTAIKEALLASIRAGGKNLQHIEHVFPGIVAAVHPAIRNSINAIMSDPRMPQNEKEHKIMELVDKPGLQENP